MAASTRRRFSPQFKAEAVQLVTLSDTRLDTTLTCYEKSDFRIRPCTPTVWSTTCEMTKSVAAER